MYTIPCVPDFNYRGGYEMYDIQKASMLKRISAFLLDFVLMTIAVTGFAFLITAITGYDNHVNTFEAKRAEYEEIYNIDLDMTEEEKSAMSAAEREAYDKRLAEADEAFSKDETVLIALNMMFNLILITVSLSLLLSFLLLEFAVPMFLKNGQTVGKKIFAIGVVHENSVKISGFALFSRTILGKYTVETMIPVIVIITMLFGGAGLEGLILLVLLIGLQLFVFFKNKLNTPLHDVLGHTVAVDLSTQMIFDNVDELIAYKKKIHAETAEKADY